MVRRICAGLDIKARLGRDLEAGACGVVDPFVGTVELRCQHPPHHCHALSGVGTEVVRAGGNYSHAEAAAGALAGNRLNLGVEVGIVLDRHGASLGAGVGLDSVFVSGWPNMEY